MEKFYVTTPIFYPTGTPHIGTAYAIFIADSLARYWRKQGADTQFLLGNDEHGANIAKKAAEEGLEPKAFVDKYAAKFKQVWNSLGITNNYFIQTTDPRHEEFAQDLLQKAYDNGDIYPGTYAGWYCSSCEAYITESDMVDGRCPNHPNKDPEWTEESNYYFRWSKYQDWLLDLYEKNPEFVRPERWLNYAKDMVKKGLNDIPVTRANVDWGVTVPFDEEQTIYVWYDALPNYLSYLHFNENIEDWQGYWQEAVHVVGKDILKFHAILWPAMLKSAGYPLPKTILTHGFFTVNNQKIGKSNNNAIDPQELSNKYGTDAVRYALLTEFQLGNDGDFSFERLESKYSSDLANNWGNLLSRVIHLVNSKQVTIDKTKVTPETNDHLQTVQDKYDHHFQAYEIFQAAQETNKLAAWGNQYINEHKPWEIDDTTQVEQILNDLWQVLELITELYEPILPASAAKARKALDKQEKTILFPKLT